MTLECLVWDCLTLESFGALVQYQWQHYGKPIPKPDGADPQPVTVNLSVDAAELRIIEIGKVMAQTPNDEYRRAI